MEAEHQGVAVLKDTDTWGEADGGKQSSLLLISLPRQGMVWPYLSDPHAGGRQKDKASRLSQTYCTGQGHLSHFCGRGRQSVHRQRPWKSADAYGYTASVSVK